MALVLKDRVKETTTSTGTGTITLAGAVSGFQSFSVVGNANVTYYAIVGQSPSTEWEVGIGTYTSSGTTLSRDTVLESSNSGSLVTFSAGTKDVFVTYPAEYAVVASNNFGTAGQVLTSNGANVAATFQTAASGLTGFTAAESTAAPNATVYVDSLTASAASTNADVAFVAKGTGATLAQVPDSTTAGGNKRGQFATDWQKSRSAATQVASGDYSTIAGGSSNTASGANAAVVGGGSSTASGNNSAVVGGFNNTASGLRSAAIGGTTNQATQQYAATIGGDTIRATGSYAFAGGGSVNNSQGQFSAVVGGNSNTGNGTSAGIFAGENNNTNGSQAVVCGGSYNTANGNSSFVLGGIRGTTRLLNCYAVFPASSSPITAVLGVSQSAMLILGRQTTDATATVLASNTNDAATTNQVILPNNSAYFFKGSCIAGVTGSGDTKAWEFKGAIKRGANAAATSIVGSVIKDVIASDSGASTWDITITADTTNGGIKVEVTGQASTTIRWVCKIETTEMTY